MRHTDDITLLDLVSVLRDGRWVIAWSVIATMLVAILVGFVSEPVYRAQVTILEQGPDQRSGASALLSQFGGLASLAGIDPTALGKPRDTALVTLNSRSFLEAFLESHDVLPTLFPDAEKLPQLWEGAIVFREEVMTVGASADTPGLLTITIDWSDPEIAAQWANGLVALVNEVTRRHDIAQAERSIAYLNEQIQATNVVELQRTLYSLVEAEQKTLMLANARDEYAFQVIDSAYTPKRPVWPNMIILPILGVVLGGMLGVFIVVLRRFIEAARAYDAV